LNRPFVHIDWERIFGQKLNIKHTLESSVVKHVENGDVPAV